MIITIFSSVGMLCPPPPKKKWSVDLVCSGTLTYLLARAVSRTRKTSALSSRMPSHSSFNWSCFHCSSFFFGNQSERRGQIMIIPYVNIVQYNQHKCSLQSHSASNGYHTDSGQGTWNILDPLLWRTSCC